MTEQNIINPKDYLDENDINQNSQNIQEPEYEQLTMFCEPIYLDTENVEDLQLDKIEFEKGLKEVSYLSGMVTGLINIGIPLEEAINYLYARLNSDMNIKIAEINCKASIESSKNTSIIMDKQQV
jgi:hypothetical protein